MGIVNLDPSRTTYSRIKNDHAEVRALATAHIEERMEDFQIYFENARAFRVWLVGMKRDRTWGDELTLRAAVDAFGMRARRAIDGTELVSALRTGRTKDETFGIYQLRFSRALRRSRRKVIGAYVCM